MQKLRNLYRLSLFLTPPFPPYLCCYVRKLLITLFDKFAMLIMSEAATKTAFQISVLFQIFIFCSTNVDTNFPEGFIEQTFFFKEGSVCRTDLIISSNSY